jgi:DNA-binding transcriptional MerR regulator
MVDDKFRSERSLLAGELAAAVGVSSDTLRHYERKGVLPRAPRSANGYRRYPASALERVKLIRSSLAMGFTLDELARVFAEREKGGAPCREVYGLAVAKLADLDEQIRSLVELRKRLRFVVADWNDRLASTEKAGKARLLESLPASSVPLKANRKRKLSPPNKKGKRRKTI